MMYIITFVTKCTAFLYWCWVLASFSFARLLSRLFIFWQLQLIVYLLASYSSIYSLPYVVRPSCKCNQEFPISIAQKVPNYFLEVLNSIA